MSPYITSVKTRKHEQNTPPQAKSFHHGFSNYPNINVVFSPQLKNCVLLIMAGGKNSTTPPNTEEKTLCGSTFIRKRMWITSNLVLNVRPRRFTGGRSDTGFMM
jgi:hypothetical protein